MAKIKCLKKDTTNCFPSLQFKAKKCNNYICAGISKKGTKYKLDNIWLCLSSHLGKSKIEMTQDEAGLLISALGCAISHKGEK